MISAWQRLNPLIYNSSWAENSFIPHNNIFKTFFFVLFSDVTLKQPLLVHHEAHFSCRSQEKATACTLVSSLSPSHTVLYCLLTYISNGNILHEGSKSNVPALTEISPPTILLHQTLHSTLIHTRDEKVINGEMSSGILQELQHNIKYKPPIKQKYKS